MDQDDFQPAGRISNHILNGMEIDNVRPANPKKQFVINQGFELFKRVINRIVFARIRNQEGVSFTNIKTADIIFAFCVFKRKRLNLYRFQKR